MQDRVPEARIYKVWLAPEWISDEATYLQLADYVLTSGKTSRLYQRLVYEDQIATDAGAFQLDQRDRRRLRRLCDRRRRAGPCAPSSARSTRSSRAFSTTARRAPSSSACAPRFAAAFIRGIEQVGGFGGKSHILAENAVYGGRPDFYKHSLALLERRHAAAGRRDGAQVDRRASRSCSRSIRSRGARRRRRGRGPLDAADAATFPEAPFPRSQQPRSRTACA